MPTTSSFYNTILILTVVCVLLPSQVAAFGAGDIPDFAYLNDKAYRHGDIENVLSEVAKIAGHAAAGGGLLGFAKQMVQTATGGSKFTKGDIKKIYFGNWLRDYSQAMDIAGLSKLSADTIVLIVAVLGFMEFGFATEEFEVTADRLGVYLPTEHIDNPKGYAAKEGDARQYHPKLRAPVNDRELEIDERTGMKRYMASENEGWDTSTALIRRTLRSCIERGRRSEGREGGDLWEAYRLLGTALHTLEDLLAHSNWCEIALRKMGHREVFCHVGDDTDIDTPSGRAPPLVTGTFGGADFLHSLMGEATDKLSQTSVTALNEKMNQANSGDDTTSTLRAILTKLPIGGGSDKMNEGEELHAKSQGYHFNPDNVCPPEVQRQLLDVLKWRDGVFRDISKKIEMVPGLSDVVEELTNALNAYVYTLLAPWLTPILTQVSSVLGEGSKAVIDSEDQYEVFDNSRASDPSHSLLSKDHFALILNEPAGQIAKIVVVYTVDLIVQAWGDNGNPDDTIDRVLEAFHHPYYNTGRSDIQNQMFQAMEQWLNGQDTQQIIGSLTKESVRDHKNKRRDDEGNEIHDAAHTSHGHGGAPQSYSGGHNQQSHKQDSYGQSYGQGGVAHNSGYGADQSDYRRTDNYGSSDQTSRRNDTGDYGSRQQSSYGHQEDTGHGSHQQSSYGQQAGTGYGSHREESYGRSGNSESYQPAYQSHEESRRGEGERRHHNEGYQASYERSDNHGSSYGSGGRDQGNEYGSRRNEERNEYSSGRSDNYQPSYGSGGRDRETEHHSRRDDDSYDRSSRRNNDDDNYGSHNRHGHGGNREYESGEYSAGSGSYGNEPHSGRSELSGGPYSSRSEASRESNDETYGAERLNLDDNDGYRSRRKREEDDY